MYKFKLVFLFFLNGNYIHIWKINKYFFKIPYNSKFSVCQVFFFFVNFELPVESTIVGEWINDFSVNITISYLDTLLFDLPSW